MTSAPELGVPSQTAWKQDVLHVFSALDGRYPDGGLIADRSGALYGTTGYGGPHHAGAIYKLTPPAPGETTWESHVLYSFRDVSGDAEFPQAGLEADVHGNLYGTTFSGGAYDNGAVFMLKPPVSRSAPWTESVIYSFSNANGDGSDPIDKLLIGADGSLYGTTYFGGNAGVGIVFRLVPPAPEGASGPKACYIHSQAETVTVPIRLRD